uniref:Secreted protein n=1 Tax=Labrus bergylta TaxID=56723 RepID=A0A3Q3GL28_9LABR
VLTLKVHRFLLLLLPYQVLCLVQQQRHGLCLLWLRHQHCVAAQHHRLVLHLVPVNPGENLGQPRVRDTICYPVQQVQVSWPPGLIVNMHHPDALLTPPSETCDWFVPLPVLTSTTYRPGVLHM